MPNPLFDTVLWFEQAVPKPTTKNINAQTGCHFEEVAEMLAEMRGTTRQTEDMIRIAESALAVLGTQLKKAGDPLQFVVTDETKFLDALCDQIVTATGVAHMRGYAFHGAMMEVNASNFSKFVDGKPVFAEGGKIQKGPHYFKPDLSKFLPL